MGLFDSIRSAFRSSGGKVIDVEARFERSRTAATGTMSSFFVARDRERGEMVGIKLIDPEKLALYESRFKGLNKPSEGEIAMQMRHPRVVDTYEFGVTTKGQKILVMEYIAGPGMQDIIVRKQEEVVAGKRLMLIRQMAEALQYVHSQGFIHRDICPRNYICLPDVTGVKLIDFGLTVPATKPFMTPGNRTGTPLYMSPEIVRRRPTDKRVDIFSFGVTCYCLLTFAHPWQGEVVTGRAALHHDTNPPTDILQRRPDIDPKLARAVMHAIQPKVEQRTPTIEQFISNIRNVPFEYTGQTA